jgi:putative phosphoribosyl transferase
MIFRDRQDGGEQLGRALEKYRNRNALVLGIPRGGVETAYYVARHLNAELSLVVTRKLGYPFNPEAAFGAIAEDGSMFIFDEARQYLSPEVIQRVADRERSEIQRRILALREGKPLPPIEGRTVIIVDDGIATGATLFAAIEMCRKQGASKIIVAAPVSSERMEQVLNSKADEVAILSTPPFYHAVSQGYDLFDNLSDKQVLALLSQWQKEHVANKT